MKKPCFCLTFSRFDPIIRLILLCALCIVTARVANADMLDIELGIPYPDDPGSSDVLRSAMLPADTIKLRNSGKIAAIFENFEIWVLNDSTRRIAFVMANRVFDRADTCEAARNALHDIIGDRLGNPEFAYTESVETEPRAGTEYVFACNAPLGSPFVILNFTVRSGEMSREFDRISQDRLRRFNRGDE